MKKAVLPKLKVVFTSLRFWVLEFKDLNDDAIRARQKYQAPATEIGSEDVLNNEVAGRGPFERLGPGGCTTIAEADMSQRTFSVVGGVVYGLIALGHVLRIVLGWSFMVQDFAVPMWASGLAVVILGYLAYEGFRLARKSAEA
jgi:hypothetical protein